MIKLIAVTTFAILLSACSTKPAMTASGIAPMLYNKATAETATVIVTRDSGLLGSACKAYVFIDGKEVATLRSSESATLHVPSGRHVISFDTARGLCPSATDALDVIINKGDTKRYRIRGDMNGNWQLLPTL